MGFKLKKKNTGEGSRKSGNTFYPRFNHKQTSCHVYLVIVKSLNRLFMAQPAVC